MLLVKVDKNSKESLQDQLVAQILEHIENGILEPGAKLPSSRLLAKELKLSRNTVINAYQCLMSEGYIEAVAASQTRVCTILPKNLVEVSNTSTDKEIPEAIKPAQQKAGFAPIVFTGPVQELVNRNLRRTEYDFWIGRPNKKLFPHKVWQHLVLDCVSLSQNNIVQYGEPAGFLPLREAIAEHVRYSRAIPTSAEQIVVTVGIQEGLNIIAKLFLEKNRPVLIENPCYQGAAYVFQSCGATLIPIPVDDDGLVVDDLPETSGNIIYTTPSHQYPLGATLTLERRKKLIEWAERTGSYIIEDDYDSDFRYDSPPIASLSSLSKNGNVIYLGTFSKSIAAGLRIGYMVLPKQLIDSAIAVKTLFNNHNAWLDQAVLAKFIQEGHFERHLRLIRKDYQTRRDAVLAAMQHHLGDVDISGKDAGMHLTWTMPEGAIPADKLQSRALSESVGIYTVNSGGSMEVAPSTDASRKVILGYSSLNEDEIAEGIRRMVTLLRQAW